MKNIAVILCLTIICISTAAANQVWNETDWSNHNWNSVDLVDPEIAPGELVLQTDPNHFVLAFDASDYSGIWDLAVWQDNLYLAAGPNPPMMTDGADILVYDYQANSCSVDYQVFEQGIVVLKVHEGVIYSPGVDSLGSHDWGNIYFNEGAGWVRKETIPFAVHVFDLFFHEGKIWVTTGRGYPVNGGTLFSSFDMGDSWVEEYALYSGPPYFNFRRIYGATSFGGSIIMQPDFLQPEGVVYLEMRPDGTVGEHNISNHSECISGFQEFKGQLWCRQRFALYSFDGESYTLHDLPVGTPNYASRGITVFHDRLYLSGSERIHYTEDGQTWEQSQVDQFDGRVFETLEEFHGRLYAGSNPYGEVHVTSTPESGHLVSSPYCFTTPVGDGSVTWQALLQGPTTSVQFQIRSADDEDGLSVAQFLGPDGTPYTWYETSGTTLAAVHRGDRCFQYKVELQSEDERFAPVLQEFQLEVEGIVSSVEDIDSFATLTARPNPFNPQTTISWEQLSPGPVSVVVFDVSGRKIISLDDSHRASGKHSVAWDGCDQFGNRQAAGVYLVGVRQNKIEKVLKLVMIP